MPQTDMEYEFGPKDFWQVKKEGNLRFDEPLKPGDKRYVDLNKARGMNEILACHQKCAG